MQLAPTTDANLVSLLAPPVYRVGFQQVIHHEAAVSIENQRIEEAA